MWMFGIWLSLDETGINRMLPDLLAVSGADDKAGAGAQGAEQGNHVALGPWQSLVGFLHQEFGTEGRESGFPCRR